MNTVQNFLDHVRGPSIKRYQRTAVLNGHTGPINSLTFNNQGTLLASGGDDEQVRIWDVPKCTLLQSLADEHRRWGQITCIKFVTIPGTTTSTDWLYFGTGRGFFLTYRSPRKAGFTGYFSERVFTPGDSVEAFDIDKNYQRIAISSHNGTIKLCSIDDGVLAELWRTELLDAIPRSVRFVDSGRMVLIYGMETGALVCRDTETSIEKFSRSFPTPIGDVGVCPSTGVVAIDNMTNGFDLYPPNRIHAVRTFSVENTKKVVKKSAFGEAGNVLICGSDHGMVYVYSCADGTVPLQTLKHGTRSQLIQVLEAVATCDDYIIASGASSAPYTINIWKKKVNEVPDVDPILIDTEDRKAMLQVNCTMASEITSAVEHFVQDIIKLPFDRPLDVLLQRAILAESRIRALFASESDNPLLNDVYIGLIDVFRLDPQALRTRARRDSSTHVPAQHVFPVAPLLRRPTFTPSIVPDMVTFQKNWDLFSHEALSHMRHEDWQNVVVAGGSVLACLDASLHPEVFKLYMYLRSNSAEGNLSEYYRSAIYEASDIDIFIWGLSPDEAKVKMECIYQAVRSAVSGDVICVRKANTISIHADYPCRPIQIVLRLYQSPAEILAGFDIDACCCAYDGQRIWVNPRSLTALIRQANTVDMTRRSPSYELRLAKYAERGFEVYVPDLDRKRVDPSIYSESLDVLPNGLARLLVLEAAYHNPGIYKHLRFPKIRIMRRVTGTSGRVLDSPYQGSASMPCKNDPQDMPLHETEDLVDSNYDRSWGWAQIPYGPLWSPSKIKNMISKTDASMNSELPEPQDKASDFIPKLQRLIILTILKRASITGMYSLLVLCKIVCKVSVRYVSTWKVARETIQVLISKVCDNNQLNEPSTSEFSRNIYIRGPVRFMTRNPGQQLLSGSFRPIEIADWAGGAYVQDEQLSSVAREDESDSNMVLGGKESDFGICSITRAIERFVADIIKTPVDQSLDSALEDAIVAEHEIRLLFGAGHQISDLYLGLIDVFSLHPAARRTRGRKVQEATRAFDANYILPVNSRVRREDLMPSTVFNIEAFQAHWSIFTHGVLSKMRTQDWNNVIAAGGSVLACLVSPGANSSSRRLNEVFHSDAYASSDIDLFLYGLNAAQAELKMMDIYKAVRAAAPEWRVVCVRKATTISIHTEYPFRPVQVVLRLYQSPAEVLAGFDVDSACCAFDGRKVWVNPRGLTAIVRQTNTIDITRRSMSYEIRLAKYAERGFEIYVPSLDRERVKASIYDTEMRTFPNGLARLLVLEATLLHPGLYSYLKYPRAGKSSLARNNYSDQLRWACIPYGPSWDAKKIEKMLKTMETKINSPFNPRNNGQVRHRHIFFAGTMRQCLRPSCVDCNPQDGTDNVGSNTDSSNIYIKGRVRFFMTRFMVSNPGRQLMTGSFRPIDFGDWEREAYEAPANSHQRRVIHLHDSSDDASN
ncbi:hypothetical protein CVT26_002347 [Gymnopilus dilepis]|uniref:Uncharacterized protein n=1 Tax=Gymnopilus dilepis TaxID=231916 RepID=A0A409Y3J7_9AGAR|nr:hypothetical protein CVT26_002347 [Gymnopilus dilepis]